MIKTLLIVMPLIILGAVVAPGGEFCLEHSESGRSFGPFDDANGFRWAQRLIVIV